MAHSFAQDIAQYNYDSRSIMTYDYEGKSKAHVIDYTKPGTPAFLARTLKWAAIHKVTVIIRPL